MSSRKIAPGWVGRLFLLFNTVLLIPLVIIFKLDIKGIAVPKREG